MQIHIALISLRKYTSLSAGSALSLLVRKERSLWGLSVSAFPQESTCISSASFELTLYEENAEFILKECTCIVSLVLNLLNKGSFVIAIYSLIGAGAHRMGVRKALPQDVAPLAFPPSTPAGKACQRETPQVHLSRGGSLTAPRKASAWSGNKHSITSHHEITV